MTKNCVFTIVAKNYIGLAQILEKSIKRYFTDFDFYIVIADEIDLSLSQSIPINSIIAKDTLTIPDDLWRNMSFKYNLTEFCTSIKPASFRYLFDNFDYERCIYIDPDIYFFSSMAQVFDLLNDCDILLTPHITNIADKIESDAPESIWNSCGTFNLGFCGLKRGIASDKVINWWHNRLVTQCYIDNYSFQFTDQKWMDFLPSFFSDGELKIVRHLGMNIAPWNFFEREVYSYNGDLFVKLRNSSGDSYYPLIFAHYSGYNYSELIKGSVIQQNIPELINYTDINILTSIYAKAICEQRDVFNRFITQNYTYNFFENGVSIQVAHRRLYRALVDKGECISYPFSVTKDSFYSLLCSKNMFSNDNFNLDKASKTNVENVNTKLKTFNTLMRLIYKLLGFQRYMLLIRLLRPFSRYESQIHIFSNKFDDKNIY